MSKLIIVNCIEGFSASSRREEETISHVAKAGIGTFAKHHPDRPLCFNEVKSNLPSAIDDAVDFIEGNTHYGPAQTDLFCIGKSMGGVKTWWLLKSHWSKLREFHRIRMLLVDPHGPIAGDHQVGAYNARNELPYFRKWRAAPNFTAVNLYQHNHGPRGARFKDAEQVSNLTQQKFPDTADHWNITELGTKECEVTLDQIGKGLEWFLT